MNTNQQQIVGVGTCRPDGAWPFVGVRATKMPLLTELGNDTNEIRLFNEHQERFLKHL